MNAPKAPRWRDPIATMVASLDAHYPTERLAACAALLDCTKYVDDAVLDRVGAVLLEVAKDRHISERERALALLARLVNHNGRR